MLMEQVVGCASSSNPRTVASQGANTPQGVGVKRKPGRPKGSRNPNKTQVVLTNTLKQLQTMVKALLAQIADVVALRYLVLDGYFGHTHALEMTKQCGLSLISKLRVNAALYFPPTPPYTGRGRPRIYGQRFNPQQIDTNMAHLYRHGGKHLQLKSIKPNSAIKGSQRC